MPWNGIEESYGSSVVFFKESPYYSGLPWWLRS